MLTGWNQSVLEKRMLGAVRTIVRKTPRSSLSGTRLDSVSVSPSTAVTKTISPSLTPPTIRTYVPASKPRPPRSAPGAVIVYSLPLSPATSAVPV